ELRRLAANPDADPEAVWDQYRAFDHDYPEVGETERESLRATLKAHRDAQLAQKAQRAFDELVRAEPTSDLPTLVQLAEQYLRRHPDSAAETEVRRRLNGYLLWLDERDIEAARNYSARQPLNFQTRREHYQQYLNKHSGGGAFCKE